MGDDVKLYCHNQRAFALPMFSQAFVKWAHGHALVEAGRGSIRELRNDRRGLGRPISNAM